VHSGQGEIGAQWLVLWQAELGGERLGGERRCGGPRGRSSGPCRRGCESQVTHGDPIPLARRRQGTIPFVHHQRAGRQLPCRAGPRGAQGPGIRPGYRRTDALGHFAGPGYDLVRARSRLCRHEMAAPGTAFTCQHELAGGRRHGQNDIVCTCIWSRESMFMRLFSQLCLRLHDQGQQDGPAQPLTNPHGNPKPQTRHPTDGHPHLRRGGCQLASRLRPPSAPGQPLRGRQAPPALQHRLNRRGPGPPVCGTPR